MGTSFYDDFECGCDLFIAVMLGVVRFFSVRFDGGVQVYSFSLTFSNYFFIICLSDSSAPSRYHLEVNVQYALPIRIVFSTAAVTAFLFTMKNDPMVRIPFWSQCGKN